MNIRDYPLLVTEDQVAFPGAEQPLTGDQKNRFFAGLTAALARPNPTIALFSYKGSPPSDATPSLSNLSSIGALLAIELDSRGVLRSVSVGRARLLDLCEQPYLLAQVQHLAPPLCDVSKEEDEADARLRGLAGELFELVPGQGECAAELLDHFEEQPVEVVYFLASLLNLSPREAQQVLTAERLVDAQKALLLACWRLLQEPDGYPLRTSPTPTAREMPATRPAARLRDRVELCGCSPTLIERLLPEAERLQSEDPLNSGYRERLSRFEATLCYPWKNTRTLWPDLASAQRVLDEAVLGHEQVKARILDLYAARFLNPDLPCPLICLSGPPGVGKRTLASAVARAVNRPFQRIALAESEHQEEFLRGYPGRAPGEIYQAAVRANSREALLLIETASTMSTRAGEVLVNLIEPGQSQLFDDAFLGWPIDTSLILPVLVVRSPNQLPKALRERAVVLEMRSYSKGQKLDLLRERLWPEALARRALPANLALEPAVCRWLVEHHSQEDGVQSLTRAVQTLADRMASQRLLGGQTPAAPTLEGVVSLLGGSISSWTSREGRATGVVAHLSLTSLGTESLEVSITGPCRQPVWLDPEKESPTMAETLALACGLLEARPTASRRRRGWQVRVPSGALLEDEPSLGLPLALALRSAQTARDVPRNLAAVGRLGPGQEILPAGGLRERALAAQRAGFRTLLYSRQEMSPHDIEQLQAELGDELELIPVDSLKQAIAIVFQ